MILDYILDLPDSIAREFAIGIGMRGVDPVTGEQINTETQDVDDFLTEWLKIEIGLIVNKKIETHFLINAREDADRKLAIETVRIKKLVESVMKEATHSV